MGVKLTGLKHSNFYRLLREKSRPYLSRLLAAIPLMILFGAVTGGQAYAIEPVINDIFISKNKMMLYVMPGVIVLLFLLKGAASYGQSYLLEWVGQRIIADVRNDLYAHLQKLSLSYYDRTSTGELMSRITNDVNLIQGSVSSLIVGAIRETFTIISLIAVVVYQDWFLAMFALLVFPACIIPLAKFGRRLRKISRGTQETMADLSVFLNETIRGARIVKGFCREDYEVERFSNETERLFKLRIKDISTRAASHPVMEMLASFAIGAIIYYGGMLVFEGKSTMGQLMSFLAALILLYEPLKRVTRMNHDLQNGMAAADRIYAVLDTKPAIVDKPGAKELPTLSEEIRFKDVYFGYRPDELVLKDINLTVPKGQALAIVGTSGGGKTTLVNLLPRFYETTDGSISVDGFDIRDVTLHSLRNQIAIVTQQNILFNDTVKNNIAYGRAGATLEDVQEAARAAYATDFIAALPNGYDTVIGESGVLLSGGQRQRLSIARAILADKPILILDEATSNLDTESEHFVQMALENLMKGRTTFVIAHRLSTVQRADRIVVIDQGSIVEEGRHEELLANQGIYCRLHNMQFCIDSGLEGLKVEQ